MSIFCKIQVCYIALGFNHVRRSTCKAWDHYPSSVGGKTLGIGLEVFVYEVFGNITQTLCVSFPKSGKISSHLCLLKFEPKEKEISGNS